MVSKIFASKHEALGSANTAESRVSGTPAILTLKKLTQEDREFKINPGYIARYIL